MSAKTRKAKKRNATAKSKPASERVKPSAASVQFPALTVGTILEKRDRKGKVRCACEVESGGYRYEGTLYKSLSGAAAAAAKDVGLSGTSFNGYVFWGLSKPGRTNLLDRVEHLWQRYSEAALQLVKDPELKSAGLERLRRHAAQAQAVTQ